MIGFEMDGIEYRFYNHLFAVSRCGKVLRKLSPYTPRKYRKDSYLVLGRQILMHRAVAICWVENPNNAKHVHHLNGIKSDNRADNLEWVTPKQHFGERHEATGGRYVRTDATKEKYRQNRLGVKDSEEVRKVKAAILANVHPRSTCKFNGVIYPSVMSAARAAGIPAPTFRLRCLSKNFPEYELIKLYYPKKS